MEIIAGHGRHDNERKPELRNSVRDEAWFIMVYRQRQTMLHRAVAAASRTAVAENQKGRASPAEAFPDVGTLRFEADRMHGRSGSLQADIVLTAGDFHFYPLRNPSVHRASSRSGLTLRSNRHINLECALPHGYD